MNLLTMILLCCLKAPAEVVIDKDALVLGDLIEFPAGDSRSALSLGYAPNPGLARRLHDYEITGKLQMAGLPSEDLKLPGFVLVRRRSVQIDDERVRTLVTGLFGDRFPSGRVELPQLIVPQADLPTGDIQISGSLPPSFNPAGLISVRLDVRSGAFSRSMFAQARVSIEIPQPVLAHDISAHSAIQDHDIQWGMSPLTNFRDAVDTPEAIRSMLAKRDLRAGEVLTLGAMYSPLLIRRGDTVVVRAKVGGITVSATMKAEASGKYGDTILLKHLTGSGRTTARITGPGMVEAVVGGLRWKKYSCPSCFS
jgi:flagella basal body P-ring formation protein FlgA